MHKLVPALSVVLLASLASPSDAQVLPGAGDVLPPVPTVAAPTVPVPSLPKLPPVTPAPVPVPAVPAPAAPAPAPATPAPASAPSAPAATAPRTSASTQRPDLGRLAPSLHARGSSQSSPTTSSSGSATTASAPPSAAQARRQRVRRDRRLRKLVRDLRACLPQLPRLQLKVIVLRAGVASARPHSRREVARMVELRERRVARIERRAVRHLRAVRRSGACGDQAAPSDGEIAALAGTAPDSVAGDGATLADATLATAGSESSRPARHEERPQPSSSPSSRDRSGVRGESAQHAPISVLAQRTSKVPVVIALAILLALGALWVYLRYRHQRAHTDRYGYRY